MTHHDPSQAGLPGTIALLLQELRGLFRVELALAKAEVSQGAARMGVGIALIVLSVLLSFVGLLVLSGAAVIALEMQGFTLLTSVLMVGGSALGLALILILVGVRRLRPENLVPRRAMANLRADITVATEAPRARPY